MKHAEHFTHRVVVYRPDWTIERRIPVDADQVDPEYIRSHWAAARSGCDVEVEPIEESPMDLALREWAA